MGEVISIDLSQLHGFTDKLVKFGSKVGLELENALNDEAQVIATVAKELVPVDLGNLRASIKVDPPTMAFHENGVIYVSVVAGDTAVQYAQIQEDNESFQHKVGQAHYMKEAGSRVIVGIEERIIGRLEQIR